jgi:hypothetical protein
MFALRLEVGASALPADDCGHFDRR